MLRRLYVPLPPDVLGELVALARREMRRPQDQAAVLIIGQLTQLGHLPREEASDGTTGM